MINNYRYFSDDALLNRIPHAFLIIGIINATLNTVGLVLMFDRPDSTPHLLVNEENAEEASTQADQNESEIVDKKVPERPTLTLMQAIKTPEIYMITAMSTFYFIGPTNFNLYFKVIIIIEMNLIQFIEKMILKK